MLGVTAELMGLPWGDGAALIAVDRSQGMIEALWPGAHAVRAEWTRLPIEDGSIEIVLCDGGLHLLDFPGGQARMLAEVARVLVSGGVAAMRLFVPRRDRERVSAVLNDLLGGRISDLNVLKVRLAMAMQRDGETGVRLGDVWDRLQDAAPDLDALASGLGWTGGHVHAIDTYRGCEDRYHFIGIEELDSLLRDRRIPLSVESVESPTYPLGERFPTITLRRV